MWERVETIWEGCCGAPCSPIEGWLALGLSLDSGDYKFLEAIPNLPYPSIRLWALAQSFSSAEGFSELEEIEAISFVEYSQWGIGGHFRELGGQKEIGLLETKVGESKEEFAALQGALKGPKVWVLPLKKIELNTNSRISRASGKGLAESVKSWPVVFAGTASNDICRRHLRLAGLSVFCGEGGCSAILNIGGRGVKTCSLL